MAHLPFIFFTLTWLGLPGVSSTIYTMRQGQRLAESPLRSVTFSEGQGSLTRCVMACKSSEGCFSVNVHTNGLTSTITCELLGVYLHEAINGLTSVTDWTFIQEDPVRTDPPWTLAFRASNGVGLSVWDTWNEDGRHDDPSVMKGCVLPASSLPCTTHFRGYILDHWSNIDQVRVSLYKGAAVVANVTFDGQGSNLTTWLALSRLMTSTWTDMTTTSVVNYFSVEGAAIDDRRFFMNVVYNACPNDIGWLMVADVITAVGGGGPCAWEHTQAIRPTILYSPLSTAAVWDTSLAIADFMMIHVTFL